MLNDLCLLWYCPNKSGFLFWCGCLPCWGSPRSNHLWGIAKWVRFGARLIRDLMRSHAINYLNQRRQHCVEFIAPLTYWSVTLWGWPVKWPNIHLISPDIAWLHLRFNTSSIVPTFNYLLNPFRIMLRLKLAFLIRIIWLFLSGTQFASRKSFFPDACLIWFYVYFLPFSRMADWCALLTGEWTDAQGNFFPLLKQGNFIL